MYMVISRWRAKPGKIDEIKHRSKKVRAMLRAQPGVVFLNTIFDGEVATAVHAYEDEAAYQRLVMDENGAFAKAMQEHGLEEAADWIDSVKGTTED